MGLMSEITRSNMRMDTQEILTSFDWELEFTHKPNAVFYPGDQTLILRLKNVSLNTDTTNSVLQAQLRGFTVIQSGLTENSGQLTLNFQDFEDQAIAAFLEDWVTKCNTRSTRRSVHKRDLYADITVRRLNSFRKAVREWRCETCLPSSGSPNDQFTAEKALLGDCSLQLMCEYIDNSFLNLA